MVKGVAADVSSLKCMLKLPGTFLTPSEVQWLLYVPTVPVLKNSPYDSHRKQRLFPYKR
jgi:hypothetical protein